MVERTPDETPHLTALAGDGTLKISQLAAVRQRIHRADARLLHRLPSQTSALWCSLNSMGDHHGIRR